MSEYLTRRTGDQNLEVLSGRLDYRCQGLCGPGIQTQNDARSPYAIQSIARSSQFELRSRSGKKRNCNVWISSLKSSIRHWTLLADRRRPVPRHCCRTVESWLEAGRQEPPRLCVPRQEPGNERDCVPCECVHCLSDQILASPSPDHGVPGEEI